MGKRKKMTKKKKKNGRMKSVDVRINDNLDVLDDEIVSDSPQHRARAALQLELYRLSMQVREH